MSLRHGSDDDGGGGDDGDDDDDDEHDDDNDDDHCDGSTVECLANGRKQEWLGNYKCRASCSCRIIIIP